MFIPTQLSAHISAKIIQIKKPGARSNSPPPIRTAQNMDNEIRRISTINLNRSKRSKSAQPKRMPHPPPKHYYRLSSWMGDLGYLIDDLPITEIKMPGTHDSATYNINKASKPAEGQTAAKLTRLTGDPKDWTVTQHRSFRTQLLRGSRFFDLRISYENDEGCFYFHHGLKASSLGKELNVISDFLKQHPSEFIILKMKPTNQCASKLNMLVYAIHQIVGKEHTLTKIGRINGQPVQRKPNELKMRDCAGKVMIIIDARGFSVGGKDAPAISRDPYLFGSSILYSKWPNKRNFDKLIKVTLDNQPTKENTQLYCFHFTFTANAKYVLCHMGKDKKVHNILGLTKKLETKKTVKRTTKDNWHYLVSLLRARRETKRDININVVDFLDGLKSHRVILLNYPENNVPPLPPPISKVH